MLQVMLQPKSVTHDSTDNKHVCVHAMTQSAPIGNNFGMTQIAYGSTGSYLSYVGPYPYYMRVCPDDGFQGKILANLAAKWGWLGVSTFTSLDLNGYGTDISQQFGIEGDRLGIKILSAHQFREGEDLKRVIAAAKITGARVFVLAMKPKDAGRLIEQGFDAGLFTEGTTLLVSAFNLVPSLWQQHMTPGRKDIPTMLKGIIGVKQHLQYDTPKLVEFTKRWRALDDTNHQQGQAEDVCLTDQDDDGNFLYQGNPDPDNATMICAGLAFARDFNSDGSDINPFAVYAYDSVMLLSAALQWLFDGKMANGRPRNNLWFVDDLQIALISITAGKKTGKKTSKKMLYRAYTYLNQVLL